MTDTNDASEFEPRDYIYGGKYLSLSDNALFDQLIEVSTGKSSGWKLAKAPIHVIGGVYAIPTSPDGSRIRTSEAVYSGEKVEQAAELEAKSHADRVRLAQIRASANAAKQEEFQTAMEPLRQIARSLRTGADKDALIARVIRDLANQW